MALIRKLMQPGEKDSIADSKVGACHIVCGTVVISLFSKIWMFIGVEEVKITKECM